MTSFSAIYLLASTIVGLAQIVDAFVLLKYKERKGVVRQVVIAFSIFEYVWAGFSFSVLSHPKEPIPHWLPLSFVAYVVIFSVIGVVTSVIQAASGHRGVKGIPDYSIVAGGIFGVYFAIASALNFLSGL